MLEWRLADVFFFSTIEEFKCSNDVPACQAGSVFGTSVWQCCFYLYLNFSALRYRQHCFLNRSFCISVERCWCYVLSDLWKALHVQQQAVSLVYLASCDIQRELIRLLHIGWQSSSPRCKRRSFKTQCRQDCSLLCIASPQWGLNNTVQHFGLIVMIYDTVLL